MPPLIAVHLGAGKHGQSKRKLYQRLCKDALSIGIDSLVKGKPAVNVCTQICRLLEDSPLTNAGYGSQLTENGTVECDASLMESKYGIGTAVSSVSTVKNPIEISYKLYENLLQPPDQHNRSRPLSLCGHGALDFARLSGCTIVPEESMISPEAKLAYDYWDLVLRSKDSQDLYIASNEPDEVQDTVGVICIDLNGIHCACSSSGGVTYKHPGRTGPAAIIGASTFVACSPDQTVACCSTGQGEDIISLRLSSLFSTTLLQQPYGDEIDVIKQILRSKDVFVQSDPVYIGLMSLNTDPKTGTNFVYAHTTDSMVVGCASPSFTKVYMSVNSSPGTIVTQGRWFSDNDEVT